MAGSNYVLVCAESKVSDRRRLSELYIPAVWLPPTEAEELHTWCPCRVWLFMLGKDSAPSGRARWSVLAMSLLCFILAVKINNFYVCAFYRNIRHDDSLHNCRLDSLLLRYNQLLIKLSLSLLVMPMLITLSGWSRSLLRIGIDVVT